MKKYYFCFFKNTEAYLRMNSIKILTGQHVIIEYKPAGLIQRIFATLIDFIFQACYIIAFVFIFSKKFDDHFFGNRINLLLFCIFLIPILFYHFLFEVFMGGQTPGKALTKIKVTNLDGSITGLGGYFLRWILRPIDMLFNGLVAVLFILISKNHQRIGDIAAGTVVIKVSPKNLDINPEFYSFGEDYQVQYPQAEKLTKGQIKLIQDMLNVPVKNEFENDDYLDEIAEKTKSVLGIVNKENSRKFLVQIIKDYNYYTSLGF
jgi:uncharacterized RDD family membrane protein YckC